MFNDSIEQSEAIYEQHIRVNAGRIESANKFDSFGFIFQRTDWYNTIRYNDTF